MAPPRNTSLLDVVANAEALDERTVVLDVLLLDVGQETTTLTDEHEQATTGVMVLLVLLQVLGLPYCLMSSALRSLLIAI